MKKSTMTIDEIHRLIAKDALGEHPDDDDALGLMLLLHTHRIHLREPILTDRPGVLELAAITQRHASEVVAAVWPNRVDAKRIDRGYWFFAFNARTPYEVVEDIPAEWMIRVRKVLDRLSEHRLIGALKVED